MSANPFDQPYSPVGSPAPAAPSNPRQITSLIIPPTPPDLAPTTDSPEPPPTGTSSQGKSTGRRVQWPAELSRHVSVHMASPTTAKNLEEQGGEDALRRALEEHSQNPDAPFPSRYVGSSAPNSEGNSTAVSSDGDHEERMADMRDQMEVFVDPGETDGLPGASVRGEKGKTEKAAWNLVRTYTTGAIGFRRRKNAGFKGGMGEGATESPQRRASGRAGADADDDDEKEEARPGFFRTAVRERNENVGGAPDRMGFGTTTTATGGGGILSALMALQNQQQAQPASGATSAATTPTSSYAPSRRSSIGESDDDEDEDAERMKFTNKQREKRATKNAWHATSGIVGDIGKSVAGAAYGGGKTVTGVVYGGGKLVAGVAVGGAGAALGGVGAVLGVGHHRRSGSHDPATSPGLSKNAALNSFISSRSSQSPKQPRSPTESATPPSPGIHAPRRKNKFVDGTVQQLKKLGGSLGIEVESSSSRPEAAKSGAGVFGGLVLSTANLTGPAAPAAAKLAPSASRPGYHLSRYSAPIVSTRKSVDASRKSAEHSRPSSMAGHSNDSPSSHTAASTAGNSAPSTPPITSSGKTTPSGLSGKSKPAFSLNLKDLTPAGVKHGFHSHSRPGSGDNSPRRELGDYFMGTKETAEQRETREWEKEKKRRRKVKEKRKQEEVFITLHVAAILSRQDFIMKMARSFMMFGAPSHRLEAQMQATARVLEINCQVIYIPGVMLISFGDTATHTSEIKFLKQANGLDLGKLLAAYYVYYKVIYDKISVTEASIELDELMVAPPKYKLWQNLVIGGFASAFIQPSAFYGSFIDCLVAVPLGALLVLVQVVVSRNDLYSSLFEIVIACINAFLAAALASTDHFCFAAVASGSVVLILPGYIVLCGALELANRSIISGSVRLVYSILYSLFLGFGLAMGSEVYKRVTGLSIAGAEDYTCSALRVNAPWYKAVIPPWFFFLTIPCYLLMLGLRNGQPLFRRETIIMILIGCAGFSGNYFSGKVFVGRADICSAIGSFVVGFLGNVYGKFTHGSPFVVMVVGVLLQLPSGLSNGGLLQFTSDDVAKTSYSNAGFTTATSLVEVAIGLTVGLFLSAAIVNFFGGGRRRGSNLSSF